MHSQVSASNLEYFVSEDRVPDHVGEEDLRERYDSADGALIVCNVCGSIKEVDG
jgi:hypothetical protein